jgi:hypothetical protein
MPPLTLGLAVMLEVAVICQFAVRRRPKSKVTQFGEEDFSRTDTTLHGNHDIYILSTNLITLHTVGPPSGEVIRLLAVKFWAQTQRHTST